MANKRRKTRSRLSAQAVPLRNLQSAVCIPIWWVNTVIGIFLLPIAGILTQTFFASLSRETIHHGFWATEEFWFFALGALLWIIAFFGLPRPILIYVFGHELTHAVWVWLMGGRVSQFKVGSDGGHIITDKHNVWIALAPYFYPIYSMALLVVYAVVSLFIDMSLYHRAFFGLLGSTWAFHITFTLWMIPKGQSDLSYHGTFYSLVLIYCMNLVVLGIMLIVASPHVTWIGFGRELLDNTENFASWIWSLAVLTR